MYIPPLFLLPPIPSPLLYLLPPLPSNQIMNHNSILLPLPPIPIPHILTTIIKMALKSHHLPTHTGTMFIHPRWIDTQCTHLPHPPTTVNTIIILLHLLIT